MTAVKTFCILGVNVDIEVKFHLALCYWLVTLLIKCFHRTAYCVLWIDESKFPFLSMYQQIFVLLLILTLSGKCEISCFELF